MKIFAIYQFTILTDDEAKMINELLSKNINNDIIYESTFINIAINNTLNPIDFIYRIIWERMYLRRNRNVISYYNTTYNEYFIRMSVAEAIVFINTVTPPPFRDKIHILTSSMSDIIESLETFLMVENDQLEYNLSVFCKCMNIGKIDMKFDYNFNRMKMLRKINPRNIVADVIYTSTSFDKVYLGKVENDAHIIVVINCFHWRELFDILRMIYLDETHGKIRCDVLCLYKSDMDGYFVELYFEQYNSNDDKLLSDIIKQTYAKIIK